MISQDFAGRFSVSARSSNRSAPHAVAAFFSRRVQFGVALCPLTLFPLLHAFAGMYVCICVCVCVCLCAAASLELHCMLVWCLFIENLAQCCLCQSSCSPYTHAHEPLPLDPTHEHQDYHIPTLLVLVALLRCLVLQMWLLALRVRRVRVCLRHSPAKPRDVSDIVEEPFCGNCSEFGVA